MTHRVTLRPVALDTTPEGSGMQDATKTQELFGQLAGKTIDMLTVWAEANQRILRELVDLGTGATREGVRVYAE
ncbi:MAG TPA: hypothetical protein VID04_17400, partial [Methylomirabilota bacterium]